MTDTGERNADGGGDVSRRDAVKAFSLVGMAGALGVSVAGLERATNAVAALSAVRNPPSGQQPVYVPKFFTRR